MARATHWVSVSPCSPSSVIHRTVSSPSSVWLGKVTVKDEIRSSNRGGLMPAASSEPSIERMPEPRFSQTVRVSPGSGTSSSSLMNVALRADETPSSPRLSMVTGPTNRQGPDHQPVGIHLDLDLRAARSAGQVPVNECIDDGLAQCGLGVLPHILPAGVGDHRLA